ncbi:sulfite exporter TauE/SafE family protein [Lysinibacillus sp. NPDC097287]|uniref:sulfite exporter TauE/SafE family protein n=1 Tax=Lysinibacillus sp. NPDC097287 TaxID=3364144 RepID=UPI00381AD407
METIFIFICIILVATILQASTGFGFSIMATPFLLMLFLPQEAIQINIILSLIISTILIWRIRKDIDKMLLKRISLGSIVGIPFGFIIFMLSNITVIKLVVGVLLLLLTLLLICNFKMKATPMRDFIVGGVSGALTTSIGMPGPPLLLYFTGTNIKKEHLRATTLAFFLFIFCISLLTQILFTGTSILIWQSSLYAIPIVCIGLYIGQIIFKRINQQIFRLFTYILLICTGMFLLIESIKSLLQ